MFCPSEFALLNLRNRGVYVLTRLLPFAGAVTAIITNPLWLVRVRMFTSRADSPTSYRGLWGESCVWSLVISVLISIVDGLSTIVRQEGPLGLFRGTSLALVGVSSGAIQFMVYEKMKSWGFERKRRQYARAGKVYGVEADKLVRCIFRPVHKQNSEY